MQMKVFRGQQWEISEACSVTEKGLQIRARLHCVSENSAAATSLGGARED